MKRITRPDGKVVITGIVPLNLPPGLSLNPLEGQPDGYTLDMLWRDTHPDSTLESEVLNSEPLPPQT